VAFTAGCKIPFLPRATKPNGFTTGRSPPEIVSASD
jgi:hypothetical protein